MDDDDYLTCVTFYQRNASPLEITWSRRGQDLGEHWYGRHTPLITDPTGLSWHEINQIIILLRRLNHTVIDLVLESENP